jgi:hypothetical protein
LTIAAAITLFFFISVLFHSQSPHSTSPCSLFVTFIFLSNFTQPPMNTRHTSHPTLLPVHYRHFFCSLHHPS